MYPVNDDSPINIVPDLIIVAVRSSVEFLLISLLFIVV